MAGQILGVEYQRSLRWSEGTVKHELLVFSCRPPLYLTTSAITTESFFRKGFVENHLFKRHTTAALGDLKLIGHSTQFPFDDCEGLPEFCRIEHISLA